ncbi:hypothetical protein VOLCADRAFT_107055 [Volvox carteri f. nagariensis]|uniref:Uncharacterized protein n=1 Tax=Volvox carteri f. nagariensis TaxID=3068 RepID=D8UBQ3_VOLCA|nr:uncharacterized protein VOLCADRAFT_107055 [Volvox carteri f. nagariensis]EFJ42866.1 hypothetical protein VOLCADRAFT_107055 [Volvox carteri f. nagariensis]|eukprot:XP_002956126.1 hypothetical protein VOLCADRAFT_107055 [Volvox carteri f. nagariensis]
MEIQQVVPPPPSSEDSLVECALKVLECPNPWRKAEYTSAIVKMWREGVIKLIRPAEWQHLRAPDRPARSDDTVRVCAPGETPRRGKGGTLASRQALLHSAVHIENWAVDLSWDIVARFGLRPDEYDMPRQFFDDFVTEIGSYYGAFAVHDGLWESASSTAHSLPARLAVEHCVHEARGLDVLPASIAKFANNGDAESAALLRDTIYPEEVSHCAAGIRWIKYLYGIAHGTLRPGEASPGDDAPAAAAAAASPASLPKPSQQPAHNGGGLAATTSSSNSAVPDIAEADLNGSRLAGLEVGDSGVQEQAGEAAGATEVGDGATESRQLEAADGVHDQARVPFAGNGTAGGCSTRGADGGGSEEASYGVQRPVAAAAEAEAALPDWVLDARKYGSVQEWFHSLVRAHFWGGLKASLPDREGTPMLWTLAPSARIGRFAVLSNKRSNISPPLKCRCVEGPDSERLQSYGTWTPAGNFVANV